jgi:hypothetical protein
MRQTDEELLGALEAVQHPKNERERHYRHALELELRLRSPKRPGHVDAADANHLPLFVAANEPRMI